MGDEQKHGPFALYAECAARWMLVMLVAVIVFYGTGPVQTRAYSDPGLAAVGGRRDCQMVVPMGRTVGIKLFADGVLVVGLSDLDSEGKTLSPAKACGLQTGDIITHINREEVHSIEQVQQVLKDIGGEKMSIRIRRGDRQLQLTAQTVKSGADGAYRLGAWIRDSMAGIGTMTFYHPASGTFGALGHGINDVDTALLIPLREGSILYSEVVGVKKGTAGAPGELHGAFQTERDLGSLYANTPGGIFGVLGDESLAGDAVELPVARRREVKIGPAIMLSNISQDIVEAYDIEIVRVYPGGNEARDLMIKVTDKRLLEATGGIVQGMSGSPIIQNGYMIGAVTHVLINDPTTGYGVLAEQMLQKANIPAAAMIA